MTDDIKVIGLFPLPENRLSGGELDVAPATGDGFKVRIAEALKERMFPERRFKCFHDLFSCFIQAMDDNLSIDYADFRRFFL
jgi:myosin-crossreactive antigen